jgi:hypothetical protein
LENLLDGQPFDDHFMPEKANHHDIITSRYGLEDDVAHVITAGFAFSRQAVTREETDDIGIFQFWENYPL